MATDGFYSKLPSGWCSWIFNVVLRSILAFIALMTSLNDIWVMLQTIEIDLFDYDKVQCSLVMFFSSMISRSYNTSSSLMLIHIERTISQNSFLLKSSRYFRLVGRVIIALWLEIVYLHHSSSFNSLAIFCHHPPWLWYLRLRAVY